MAFGLHNHLQSQNSIHSGAVQAAYESGEEWLQQVNRYIDDNLTFLKTYLEQHLPKVRYHIPEGTYLAWLDFRLYELSDSQLDHLIKYDAKVLLDPGHIFGESGQGFQRINVSCPRSILHQALDRITSAFND